MPDNPIAGLYPQPQPQNTIMSDPSRMIGLVGQMNALRSQQAIGEAYQGAIGADGKFDPNAAALAIKNNPNAAWGAKDAAVSLDAQRGQQINNATGQFGLLASQSQSAMGLIAGLAQDPNPSLDKVNNLAPVMARMGIPAPIINAWRAGLSRDPATLHQQLGTIANTAMGPGAAASRITGPVGSDGQPTSITTGQGNIVSGYGGPVARTSTGTPVQTNRSGQAIDPSTGQPTQAGIGITTGQSPIQTANQSEYLADQTRSANTLANVRPLEQALPLIQQLSNQNFGPGSTEFAKIKGGLATLGLIDPNTSDATIRQEVNKKLLGYASGARDAGRSDNALSAALGSNPNLDLTQPANLALVKNQIGMDKMDAALPIAAGTHAGYKDVKSKYYQSNDSRAFAINTMTPQEIAQLQSSLKGPARDKFNRSLQIAIQAGIVTPPGAGGGP